MRFRDWHDLWSFRSMLHCGYVVNIPIIVFILPKITGTVVEYWYLCKHMAGTGKIHIKYWFRDVLSTSNLMHTVCHAFGSYFALWVLMVFPVHSSQYNNSEEEEEETGHSPWAVYIHTKTILMEISKYFIVMTSVICQQSAEYHRQHRKL